MFRQCLAIECATLFTTYRMCVTHPNMSTYTAKSFVPIAAAKFCVAQPTAHVIDRSLAEAGLRQKGKGKSRPPITRREAIVFLLACMVTQKPTHAADDVRPWISTNAELVAPEKQRSFDMEEWRGESEYDEQLRLLERAKKHLSHYAKTVERVSLVEWLLAVCALLEEGEIEAAETQLEICQSEGTATVEILTRASDALLQTFYSEVHSPGTTSPVTAIRTSSIVTGLALMEIVWRTEGLSLCSVDGAGTA